MKFRPDHPQTEDDRDMRLLPILATLPLLYVSVAANKPNFVFILADDMGWTGTSVQVDPSNPDSRSDFYQTPNLEKLATQGMLFSNAYSPGPMCTPSRAAILTGKTPAELHMTAPGGGRTDPAHKLATPRIVRELPQQETTIAELLKTMGYATAYFGKWHQGQVSPGNHGFDVHDGPLANEVPASRNGPKDVFGVNERAMQFIEAQVEAGKPFYVQLSHWAVHGPFESSEASLKKFEAAEKGKHHTDPVYAGMTFDLDTSIGILLEKIEELHLSDSTYVIFMSDNGAPSGERQGAASNYPLRAGKSTLYEGGIRVPLLVRGPGIAPASLCKVNVTGCDLYPTLGELAGIQLSHEVAGSSLVPLLMGKDGFQRQHALLFHYPHYGRNPRALKPQSALIRGNYKLLLDMDSGRSALYDLNKDISEESDLSDTLPEIKSELVKLMDRRLSEADAQMMTPNPDYDPDAVATSAGPRTAQGGAGATGAGNVAQGRSGPLGPDAFMERFDKNRDGKVTRDEFDGPAPRWQRLDTDGDGVVRKQDVPTTPAGGPPR